VRKITADEVDRIIGRAAPALRRKLREQLEALRASMPMAQLEALFAREPRR
jgi:hypothetical protein